MILRPGQVGRGATGKRAARIRLAFVVVLVMLFIITSLGLAVRAPAQDVPWGSVPAAAGDGGSTVPIPPPERPTPQGATATPSEAAAPTGRVVDMRLDSIGLGSDLMVRTADGIRVSLTGSNVLLEGDVAGAQRIIFPFALPPGQGVMAFQDPESGIGWLPGSKEGEGGTLTIPVAVGQVPGILTVRLGPLSGDGQQAEAPVLGVSLAVGPVELDEASLRGSASVRLLADLEKLPSELFLNVQGVTLDSGYMASINEAVEGLELGVADVAYATEVLFRPGDAVTSASIEMSAEKTWADAWPGDRIRFVRVDAKGESSILETTLANEDISGRAWFRGKSPEGFSTFALVALGELATQETTSGLPWAFWVGIGLGIVGLVGLAGGVLLLVSSRRGGTGS